jgi:hypothetical protein
VAALVVATAAVALPPYVAFPAAGRASTVAWLGVAWLAFAAGAWLVGRLAVRVAVALIVVGGLAMTLAAGFSPPRSSDDVYRYIWDGRVQAAGIDPYRYPPAAPELTGLRDGYLWTPDGAWCVTPKEVSAGFVPGCTRINRPAVPTIYPPVAEALFLTVHGLSPLGAQYQPWQLLGVAFALATTILLLLGLRRLRLDPRRAVLWAWCPTVAVEAGSNAHIDVAAAFLAGAALLALARATSSRRTVLGGVLIGLAIACKVTPVLLMPAVLRRRPVAVVAAAAGAVAVVYLPHLLATGARVLGYIPGYLQEEGYADGSRFALLSWLLPQRWAAVVAVLILAAVAFVVLRTTDPDRPWLGATTMVGSALLITTPSYPWYAILLVMVVGWGGRVSWLAVAAAGYLAQYAQDLALAASEAQRLGYGLAGALVVVHWWRQRADRPPWTRSSHNVDRTRRAELPTEPLPTEPLPTEPLTTERLGTESPINQAAGGGALGT